MQIEKLNSWLMLGANVGVLIGLLLLVYEIRQNTSLMRAEIHSMRAEGKATRQMDIANDGELMEIVARANAAGFPTDPNAFDSLSGVEKLRLQYMYIAIIEATVNWHIQCEHGLLIAETCDEGQRRQILGLMPQARAARVSLSFTPPSFISEVQRVLTEAGLTPPDDTGAWPDG